MENGLLSCEDTSLCPRGCPICTTCMSILGCTSNPENPLVSELVSSKFQIYLIAAAAALVMITIGVYYSRSRRHNHAELRTSLIEKEKMWKMGVKLNPDICMFIDGDEPWKPPSHDDYTPQTIQPINIMSTSSTSRCFEEKVQPFGGESLLGEMKSLDSSEEELSASNGFSSYPISQTTSALKVVDTIAKDGQDIVSPISSPGGSLDGSETHNDLEDEQPGLPLTVSSENRSVDDEEDDDKVGFS